ncbi:uncharacterized protein LOC143998091 [Lithobates pipiens]
MTPEIFGKKMILEQGFSKAETLSVQAFTRGTFFVTFVSFQACRRYWDMVKASGPESPFRKFAANCPITRDEKWVTVAMRNPHTSGKDIATYLQRFCTVVKDPVRILDANGFWIGKWSVLCKFRKDPSGDILHLQPCFSLGNSAGILFYPGIPFTCNRCSNTGHMGKDCKEPACRSCRVAGHETKDCPRSKACNLCGAAEHVFKHCPQRSRSYAGALIQGKPSSSTRKKPPEREKEPQKTTGKHTPTPTPVQAPARTPAPTSSTPPPATPVVYDNSGRSTGKKTHHVPLTSFEMKGFLSVIPHPRTDPIKFGKELLDIQRRQFCERFVVRYYNLLINASCKQSFHEDTSLRIKVSFTGTVASHSDKLALRN